MPIEQAFDTVTYLNSQNSLRDAQGVVIMGASQAVQGTRAYNFAQGTRTSVAATSSAEVAIGTLGASREVMLIASTRCHIRFGATGLGAASASAGVLPLPADTMFHLVIPVGVTHFRVIRDNVDGFLTVIPVI